MNHDTSPEPAEFEHHADVSSERLARVYAAALLSAADGQESAVIAEIDTLLDGVLRGQPQLEAFFAGAAAGRNARRAVLEKTFADRVSPDLYRFLMVLNEHERLDLLRPIRTALHQLDDERHQRTEVHVYTAVPLTADGEQHVGAMVRTHFGLEPVLVAHVDPALLGGLKLRIGDKQFDATVRTRLDNLRNQVIARSSYEIQSRRDHFRTN